MSASDFDRVRKALEALVYIKSSQHDSNSAENCSLTTVSSASAPAKGAKYRPWDRSDLFRRLRSFTSSKWFCKPECISPLECARRGWLNSKLDRLQCEFCEAQLSFPLSVATAGSKAAPGGLSHSEIFEEAKKFAGKLDSGHDDTCPWRNNACDQGLAVFPATLPDTVCREFQQQAAALAGVSALPPLSSSTLHSVCQHRRSRLASLLQNGAQQGPVTPALEQPQSANAQQAELPPIDLHLLCSGLAAGGSAALTQRAQLLALFGWSITALTPRHSALNNPQGSKPAGSCVLSCALCGAQEGLWLYIPADAVPLHSAPPPASFSGPSGSSSALQRITLTSTNIAGGHMTREAPITPTTSPAPTSLPPPLPQGPFGASHAAPAFSGLAPAPGPPAASASSHQPSADPVDAVQSPGQPAAQAEVGVGVALPASAPFGSSSAGDEVFGLHALASQRSQPFSNPQSGRALAGVKRKWADGAAAEGPSEGEDAREKRARGAYENGASGTRAPAAIRAFQRHAAKQLQPFDPLHLHRPFCPWRREGPPPEHRCGWRWSLDSLVPRPGPEESPPSFDGQGQESRESPAARLRALITRTLRH